MEFYLSDPIFLLSQKRVQRFDDHSGNSRIVFFCIGFDSFREQTRDLYVKFFGDIITLIFESIVVHWLSLLDSGKHH